MFIQKIWSSGRVTFGCGSHLNLRRKVDARIDYNDILDLDTILSAATLPNEEVFAQNINDIWKLTSPYDSYPSASVTRKIFNEISAEKASINKTICDSSNELANIEKYLIEIRSEMNSIVKKRSDLTASILKERNKKKLEEQLQI